MRGGTLSETKKKILVVDEEGFSRICAAMLKEDGFMTETIMGSTNIASGLSKDEYGLFITSYPYGHYFIDSLRERSHPMIILSDHINDKLLRVLNETDNTYCMIKPINFEKFRTLVREMMNGEREMIRGYAIL